MKPGDVIRGKYRVDGVLGRGGMGTVVAAWDPDLERWVAIKRLHPAMRADPDSVQRFLREARAAARIQSDNVVRVFEVTTADDGAPLLVMERLEGRDLRAVIKDRATVPISLAARWVCEACSAIAVAHGLGIVHRDLKPANLFLARRRDGSSRVKVLDFGISKVVDAAPEDGGVTSTSMILGSPGYMSPEQCLSSRDVDACTDVWSLGIILYELCTGRVPFTGETATQVYVAVLQGGITPPTALRADMPKQLEALILGCLQRDREARPSIQDLARALAPFAEEGAVVFAPSEEFDGTLPLDAKREALRLNGDPNWPRWLANSASAPTPLEAPRAPAPGGARLSLWRLGAVVLTVLSIGVLAALVLGGRGP
jgi:serine/threonine-protein kinase